MLSNEEKLEIEKVIAESLHWKDASVEALMVVQKRRGWISDELLEEVAKMLKMSPAELDSTVTFYDRIYREPVGRHVILLCDSASCWVMGYDRLRGHLKERLGIGFGETTKDGEFTLLPVSCLGACDRAPAMMVDEEFYGDLAVESVDKIIDSYREAAK